MLVENTSSSSADLYRRIGARAGTFAHRCRHPDAPADSHTSSGPECPDPCASKPGILTRFSREHWFWTPMISNLCLQSLFIENVGANTN